MDLSGSLPASSATTESTISSEFCLIFCADCKAARWPLTTTVPSAAGVSGSLGGGVVWANAVLPAVSSSIWTMPRWTAVVRNCLIVFLSDSVVRRLAITGR